MHPAPIRAPEEQRTQAERRTESLPPKESATGPESSVPRPRRWHNLRLPVKLAAVSLVPMTVMTVLGVVVIAGQLANAAQYARANRVTQLNESVRAAISALQDEREQVATPGAPATALTVARGEVDAALSVTRQGIAADTEAGDLDPVAQAAWSDADRQLGGLASLRAQSPAMPGMAMQPYRSTEVGTYTQLVDSLFAFDRVLITGVADAELTRQALSLYDLSAAGEELRYQQSVVLAGIAGQTMSTADVTALHGSEARLDSRISDFRAVASDDVEQEYDKDVAGPALAQQNSLLSQAIDESGGMSGQVGPGMVITVPVATWNAANRAVTNGLDTVTHDLAGSLGSDSTALRSAADGAANTAIAVLVVALAATIALVVLVARQLLGSIGVLRRTARDVAARQLPEAVERIRAGETVDAGVTPVGVPTADEVGQLARAFDAVHGEALRLAVEQASLRANYSELFMNLSRRSQSLVQRQLRLIEQLERDEEDPEQLSALFKLDHLATRMRRNNENLMVLSGSELARSTSQQVSLADLLRAAVSEIEHYQRVVVQPPPDAYVVGYAASDLIRLLAELLDNATAFSSPDTPVTVASHRTRRKSIVIDIVDHGIGMTDEEVARANEQLSHPAGVEGRISRRMGLYVISRLANQHDVRVRLHGGQDIPGLRVTITVPVELVIGEPEPLPTPRPGGDHNGTMPLPKRTAGASTGPNGPWQAALRGTLGMPPADPADGPVTVTIPKLPSVASSGVGLFDPVVDGETPTETPAGGGEAAGGEVTPIYDTMASAWFADSVVEPEPTGEPTWTFAADEGWHAADAAVTVRPEEYTAAGLPKRRPKALLLPGSVRHEQPDRPSGPPADHTRARLSGFQEGLRRGRSQGEKPEPPQPPEPVAVTEVTSAQGWTSSADDGWRAADEVADAVPGEVTAAGLPKRRPRAHLLPGSVAPSGRNGAHARDAGATRDRLSSFQRGVRQGRDGHEVAACERVEHGFHW